MVRLAFRVAPAQVDACYAGLRRQAVEILEHPLSRGRGHRTLSFKDPECNVLGIYAGL